MAAILCEIQTLLEILEIKEWPQIIEEEVEMLSAKDTEYVQHQKLGRNREDRLLPP